MAFAVARADIEPVDGLFGPIPFMNDAAIKISRKEFQAKQDEASGGEKGCCDNPR